MKAEDVKRYLHPRFHYASDGTIDTWEILDYTQNYFEGDCDDYAMTFAYIYSDENMWKLYWNILTFKIVFWQVGRGWSGSHVVLKIRGEGWTDNIMSNVSENPPAYKFKFPYPIFLIGAKQLLGKVKNWVRRQ